MEIDSSNQQKETSNGTSKRASNILESLPQEVLLSIWVKLDDPGALSMSSTYLNSESPLHNDL